MTTSGGRAPQLVVAAALLREGRVLAARRSTPAEVAGRWEFPGGKVEDGETPDVALVRELAEELGVSAAVTGWLPERVPVRAGLELAVALVRLIAGEPHPREHDQVRWLAADELESLDWLPADRPFLAGVRRALDEHHD